MESFLDLLGLGHFKNNCDQLYATKTENAGRVLKVGNREALAGYELVGTLQADINAEAPDSMTAAVATTFNVPDGDASQSWVKKVHVGTNSVTFRTLGANWFYAGGKAPTLKAKGVLIFSWCGINGVISYIPGEA